MSAASCDAGPASAAPATETALSLTWFVSLRGCSCCLRTASPLQAELAFLRAERPAVWGTVTVERPAGLRRRGELSQAGAYWGRDGRSLLALRRGCRPCGERPSFVPQHCSGFALKGGSLVSVVNCFQEKIVGEGFGPFSL